MKTTHGSSFSTESPRVMTRNKLLSVPNIWNISVHSIIGAKLKSVYDRSVFSNLSDALSRDSVSE